MSDKQEEIKNDKLSVLDIEFRMQSVFKAGNAVYGIIIPYKDARVDVDKLTERYGELWRNSFYRDENNGALVCKIEVYNKDIGEWISRENIGVPSNMQKEKGEYSDAIKRAGTMWGIGAELYSMPTLFITLIDEEWVTAQDKNGREIVKATNKLRPNDWEWTIEWNDDPKKTHVKAVDKKGNTRLAINSK